MEELSSYYSSKEGLSYIVNIANQIKNKDFKGITNLDYLMVKYFSEEFLPNRTLR